MSENLGCTTDFNEWSDFAKNQSTLPYHKFIYDLDIIKTFNNYMFFPCCRYNSEQYDAKCIEITCVNNDPNDKNNILLLERELLNFEVLYKIYFRIPIQGTDEEGNLIDTWSKPIYRIRGILKTDIKK
jgi:hypothetical protein